MTDHPFDEIAVEAHARSLCEREFPKRDWNTTVGPALKAEFINQSKTALTAACKSMKERGKAIDVYYQDDAHPFRPQSNSPLTIFRHGE